MGINEFAGYVAVGAAALATGWIAASYGLRPHPFYLGVAFALINASGDQLRQVRAQFEHYQSATAAQRGEERQSFERRIAQNEHALEQLREQAISLRTANAETSGQLSALRSEATRLHEELAQERRHAAAQSARDRLAADAAHLAAAPAALETRLADMATSLSEARTALAVRERELSLSEERRESAEREAAERAAQTLSMAYQLAGMEPELHRCLVIAP